MHWMEKGWFGAVAGVLTGALFAVSLDLGPVGPLALIAPLPLLLYALRAPRAWSVAVAAAVARIISMAGIVIAYGKDIPVLDLVALIATFSATYAAVVLLTRWIARAAPLALAVFSYPVVLVTAEWLWGKFAPHGSFGAMGYSLVDVLPLLQAGSLGGLAALTFCIALVPMTIAVAITASRTRPAEVAAALIAGAVPLVAALVFGFVRLAQPYTSQARVALVGLDEFEARAFRSERDDIETSRAFADQIRALAAQRPDYIVLPEKQLGGARNASGSSQVLAAAAADAAPATVVAGFDELLPDGTRVNSAQVLAPDRPLRRYFKRRTIPGVELGYTLGTESFVDGTRGVAICKDMDFPDMIRDYGRRGVELMLVPAWDFVRDGHWHSRLSVVRGVENGFAVARAAAAGQLTASDRYGRVIAEATTSPTKPVTVVTDLGLRDGGTLYTRIGDAFAWLCALAAAALVILRASTWRLPNSGTGRGRADGGPRKP
jgi:apolipoprotein N-acyltransferase